MQMCVRHGGVCIGLVPPAATRAALRQHEDGKQHKAANILCYIQVPAARQSLLCFIAAKDYK